MKEGLAMYVTAIVLLLHLASAARIEPPTIKVPQNNIWHINVEYIRDIDTKTIECHASGSTPIEYKWLKDNEEFVYRKPGYTNFDKTTGDLTIQNFRVQDNGAYQCIASNSQGSTMTPFIYLYATQVSLFREPKPEEKTINEIGNPTEYKMLPCNNAPTSVPPLVFSWINSTTDQPVTMDPDRVIIDPEGGLHFLWVKVNSDNNQFACEGTNKEMGVSVKNKQFVNFIVTPGFGPDKREPMLRYPQNANRDMNNPNYVDAVVVAMADTTAQLTCIFSYYSANDEKLRIEWLFGAGNIVGTGTTLELPNLKVPSDKLNQEGTYTCQAFLGRSNDPPSISATGRIQLKITAPPTFLPNGILESTSVPKGDTAVLNCAATSHKTHTGVPYWLKNGEPILGCHPGYYECNNGQCIKDPGSSVRCDNSPDCGDDSDEENCPRGCQEGQIRCPDGKCYQTCPATPSTPEVCYYPAFLCKGGLQCIQEKSYCDGSPDCLDGSDEMSCPGGKEITRQSDGREYKFNSERTRLEIESVTLDDTTCFQCIVANQYGSLFGSGCLTVIEKITVLKGPLEFYDVKPEDVITIYVDAVTDALRQAEMKYEWIRYDEIVDPKNEEKTMIVQTPLPPPLTGPEGKFFELNMKNRNMTIRIPDTGNDKESERYQVYMNMTQQKKYAVIISHSYDQVVLNFTINGEKIKPAPVVIVEAAATNLWFIALILAIIVLFVVVALIVCYMYRNRGGTYLLDRKERQAGHDPEQELKDSGFHDVGRVEDDFDDDKPRADEVSLSESVKPYESDEDITEEYGGDFDISKFNEDGSFIGLYGDKKSKSGTKEATV